MRVRQITVADQAEVDRLYRQLYPTTTVTPDLTSRSFSAEYLPLLVEDNDDVVQGMALGIIIQYGSLRQAYLEDVVIDEVARGQGVGRILVEYALQEFWSRGVHVAFVATSFETEIDSPLPFYRALGFRETRCPWLVITPEPG